MRRLMQGGKAESLQHQQPPAAMLQCRMRKQRLFCFFPCLKSKHPLPASWCRLFVGQFPLPSAGRKTSAHHHLAFGAVPSQKGGVLLPTVPLPVSCLTLKFCASAVQTGWIYGSVPGFSSKHVVWIFFVVVICSFSKAACFVLTPGLFFVWFSLPALNTLEVVTSLCTQQWSPSG